MKTKTQNWKFTAYNKKGNVMEQFIIVDRTEHEAQNEMLHYTEANKKIDDWSLYAVYPAEEEKLMKV